MKNFSNFLSDVIMKKSYMKKDWNNYFHFKLSEDILYL